MTAVEILKNVISSYENTGIDIETMRSELLKLINNEILELEKQQQCYSEEEVKRLAFKFYLEMSRQMNVPNNLITENYTNVDEWFEKLNPIKNK